MAVIFSKAEVCIEDELGAPPSDRNRIYVSNPTAHNETNSCESKYQLESNNSSIIIASSFAVSFRVNPSGRSISKVHA